MKYDIQDLLTLMARLRDPRIGCPWDIKQTFSSIVPHTIEEAYEVADAIGQQDWKHLEEELGDLLFQVIFYSQIGKEQNLFDLESVVSGLTEKLIRRHPHVFPLGTLESQRDENISPEEAEVSIRWDEIKRQEKALKGELSSESELPLASEIADIPLALPALTRAGKIQKKASARGFDWSDIRGVVEKIHEELAEVEEELDEADEQRLTHEIGDLLFAVVNLSRHLRIDGEDALREANHRFSSRLKKTEQVLHEAGRPLTPGNQNQVTEKEIDRAWNIAKSEEKKG